MDEGGRSCAVHCTWLNAQLYCFALREFGWTWSDFYYKNPNDAFDLGEARGAVPDPVIRAVRAAGLLSSSEAKGVLGLPGDPLEVTTGSSTHAEAGYFCLLFIIR